MKGAFTPRQVSLTIVVAICFSTLISCGLLDKLGFDTYDYMGEEVKYIHEPNDETALMLEELLMILITDSPKLPTFDNMSDAIREYRDAVLEYMLAGGYAKYSGNTALIEKAVKQYPEYQITEIIPESEFEATMYQFFGGDVKITHHDGNRFKYLPAVGAYISLVATTNSGLYADITSLAETEKTYRVRFTVCSDENDTASPEYFALIIKREDGTFYIKKLLDSAEVK